MNPKSNERAVPATIPALALAVVTALAALALLWAPGGPDGSRAAATPPPRAAVSEAGILPVALATRDVYAYRGDGTRARVVAEIADGPKERQRGLMGREALGANRGMLFVFPEERRLSFWMRDTSIPLSVAFATDRGRIVSIQNMRPYDDDEPHYVSPEPAKYALEVNRGWFADRGVRVGDRIRPLLDTDR